MKYINADKLLAEIEQLNSLVPYENNDRHDDVLHDAYKAIKNVIASLQQEAEEERIKKNKEMQKTSIEYCHSVIKHIEAKRVLPSFKGQLLHDFKNELNTMKQILNIQTWPDTQYAIFEKVALAFATWGGYHFHPSNPPAQEQDSIQQERPEVDLEKEYKEYVEDDPVFSILTNRNVGLTIARHFYELGLNSKKEE